MCLQGSDALDAPKIQQKIADERKLSNALLPTDQVPVRDWLVQSIKAWRVAADAGLKYYSPFISFVRNIRIVFGVQVLYLSAVTVAALLAGS